MSCVQLRDVATYKPKLYSNVDAEVLEGVTYFRYEGSMFLLCHNKPHNHVAGVSAC
jgi:hypothetical protein